MKSRAGKKSRKKIKQKWKALKKIGALYGLSHNDLSAILQDQHFLDTDGNPTDKALSQNFASYPYGRQHATGLFWNVALVNTLLLSLGHTTVNPFLDEARSVAKNIRTSWRQGNHFASSNEDRMAIWAYEEGMGHFECFLHKLPDNEKMEALCTMCQCLLDYKPKMTRDDINVIFKNAKCSITMDDIETHNVLLQQKRINISLSHLIKKAEPSPRKM